MDGGIVLDPDNYKCLWQVVLRPTNGHDGLGSDIGYGQGIDGAASNLQRRHNELDIGIQHVLTRTFGPRSWPAFGINGIPSSHFPAFPALAGASQSLLHVNWVNCVLPSEFSWMTNVCCAPSPQKSLMDLEVVRSEPDLRQTAMVSLASFFRMACIDRVSVEARFPSQYYNVSKEEDWPRRLVARLAVEIRQGGSGDRSAALSAFNILGHPSLIPVIIPLIEGKVNTLRQSKMMNNEWRMIQLLLGILGCRHGEYVLIQPTCSRHWFVFIENNANERIVILLAWYEKLKIFPVSPWK